ncbi:baculoviral IAP repeat-containing protein 7-like [Lingula anatina]|uniref:Baculoviral IAP repeat-containing protein 7-like n=1 Tax=Lingula anatina TaxID=7574 RepID=A0A1S3IP31_LINAN|nr:baculoviral IAP repeat-containing protein 7-like [Lingula anatina]|eukprot:XP_013399962.1 baculoviral IAP repeat-containing protein 7-like [Lingula anatina]
MPLSIPVPATRLARAGFYYSGEGDEVVCFSCGGRLREWARGDDPAVRHRNFYPNCRFLRETDTENVPLFPSARAVSNDNTGANVDPFPNLANTRSTPRDRSGNVPSLLSSQQALSRSLGISSPEVATLQTTPQESSTVAHAGVASGVRSNKNKSAPSPAQLNGNTLVPSYTSHRTSGVPSRVRNESDRLATFVNWPSGARVRPRDLARAGFFYVGTGDRVQCAFCEGILRNWEPGDQPLQEHRRHLSTCPFVLGLEVGNIPLEEPSTALPLAVSESQSHAVGGSRTGSENTTNEATLGILTARPRHERYAIENTRVQTFANWPPSRIPRPEELARAGFFYAGFGDNVKCFFCDGGLRNWEPQDDPWAEHARWFPRCGFVRLCKGDAFIQMIKEQTSLNNPAQTQTQRPQGAPGSYHVEAREIKARLDTPTVQTVLDMGFSRDTVRQAIEQRLRNIGDDFPSAASLLDVVLNIEDEMNRQTVQGAMAMAEIPQEEPGQQPLNAALTEAPPRETAQKTSQTQNSEKQSKRDKKKKKKKQDVPVPKDSDDRDTNILLEENKRLKEERTCKICMDEEVSVVFLPCGHLVACVQCAPALRNCAICRAAIKGTVRSILS